MTDLTTVANPYVGPRTFSYEQRHLFFGREREARDLLARIVSERLLLFYAQSGAGKSSLLQTRIIPQLRAEKSFGVLPVARVSGDLLPGVAEVDNIYMFNLLTSIDEGDDPARLASVTLNNFLARLVRKDGHWLYDESIVPQPTGRQQAGGQPARRYALIVDQFEEIITAHPSRWPEREQFFRQLEEAMQNDPNLWVVLTLREDYVASLDPYANLLTDRLRARFYMERMGLDAGLEAVRRPADEIGGRPFDTGVAEQLVDDLRQVRVPGQEGTVAGQYLEPVQLQVVCYQLWEKLRDQPPGPITLADLEQAGDVDQALAGFYEDALADVLSPPSSAVTEGSLRSWFDANMITEAGTRGSVYQGRYETAGIPNRVIRLLANHFLLRRELRAGGAWIELVHDRFVEPIRRANRAWLDRQSPFVRAARDWESRGRPVDLLLADTQLEAAKIEVADNPDPVLREYLKASEEVVLARENERRRRAELEQAQSVAVEANARREVEVLRAEEAEARRVEQAKDASRLRRLATALVILSLFAGVTAVAAVIVGNIARGASEVATENYEQAIAWQAAEKVQRMTAEANLLAASVAEDEAIAARELAEANATVAVAAQQTAVAERENLATVVTNLNDVLNIKAQPTAVAQTSTPEPSSLSVVLTLLPEQPLAVQFLDAVLLPPPTPTQTPSPTPNAEATSVIATAEAQVVQVRATQTVVAVDEKPEQAVQTLPFVDGVVISLGRAEGDYLLADPDDQLSGIRWIPVGTPVKLLETAAGDPDYGSGVWYLVDLPDPDDDSRRLKGYLPQEILSAADGRQ